MYECLKWKMKEIGEASYKSPGPNEDYQRQTILNLYYSGLEEDIISLQLDISKEIPHILLPVRVAGTGLPV